MTKYTNIFTNIDDGVINTPYYIRHIYADELKQLCVVPSTSDNKLNITGDKQQVHAFFSQLNDEQKHVIIVILMKILLSKGLA